MRTKGRAVPILVGLVGLMLAVGCSSFASGEKKYRIITLPAGEGTLYDVNLKTLRMLDRFNYEIVRQEDSPQMVYYQTNWKYRIPFDDEAVSGVVDARTRLTVRARIRRAATSRGTSNFYTVKVEAENLVMFADNEVWVVTPNSELYAKYVRSFAKELENELRMTISKF